MSKIAKFVAVLGFMAASAGVAHAMPAAAPLGQGNSIVSEAAFGCGPGFTRTPFGRCVPDHRAPIMRRGPEVRPMAACPRGTHLAPRGGRCIPNRRY